MKRRSFLAGLGAWQCLLWVSGHVHPARRAALGAGALGVELACVDRDSLRPRRIPEPWRSALGSTAPGATPIDTAA